MNSKTVQKLTVKWISIYKLESNEHLKQVWTDEFEGKSTPRRKEDQARMQAIKTLIS